MTRLGKLEWIAEARRDVRLGPKEPCFVCGKWADLAESHHVFPLANQWDEGVEEPDHEMVWLCPNHHAAVHFIIAQNNKTRGVARLPDLTGAEEREVFELYDRFIEACVRGSKR